MPRDNTRYQEITAAANKALEAAGLLGHGIGFEVNIRQAYDFDPVTVTVRPDYAIRRRIKHATYSIKRDDDPRPKIERVVEKARECANAYTRHKEAVRENQRQAQSNDALMRAVAAEHFPDFTNIYNGSRGLSLERDSDNCTIYLAVNSQGEVKVERITFHRFYMSVEEALAIVSAAQPIAA